MDPEHREWSPQAIVFWGVMLFLVLLWRGPNLLLFLYPKGIANDFLQDWSSARYYWDGLPVYTDLDEAARRYLGLEANPVAKFFTVNAHPPTSILLFLPLAWLDYPLACLVWQIVSLIAFVASVWIFVVDQELRYSPWALLPFLALLIFSTPFWEQIAYGQFNSLLLLLFVLAWRADRQGKAWSAGILVGIATVVKLSPGFLFLYFLLRGRWQAVVSGGLTVIVLTAVTVLVLGIGAYQDYWLTVVPHLNAWYSNWWPNSSLSAYWHKLFAGGGTPYRTISLYHDPRLARAVVLASSALVTGLTALATWRARSRRAEDLAFALCISAMLLVSPITWTHYCLMLLPAVPLWFRDLPRWSWPRFLLWPSLVVLCTPPSLFWALSMARPPLDWMKIPTPPWGTLTGGSATTYALIGLFIVALAALGRAEARSVPSSPWK